MPEAIPSDTIQTMLSGQWTRSNYSGTADPTFVDVNDGTTSVRYDFRSGDLIIIAVDNPAMDERPIGTWVYGHQTTRVLVELYTSNSRQRLYDLMREVRRVCHSQMHSLTSYQRVQFVSFNELVETTQRVWIGRIIIELLNSAVLLNTAN